ncbi:MAG: hypothetical protein EOO61_10935 [Hymenobacter sp.]|nr:MAG: hypothetical protein EOO61_10935 [Hymenobacter sp.]
MLFSDNIKPDFEYTGNDAFIDFIHRTTPNTEIYFICNSNNRNEKVDCTFRTASCIPEIWNPVNGEHKNANAYIIANGKTTIPLAFEPHQSWFIIFNKLNVAKRSSVSGANFTKLSQVEELTGAWNVKFDPKWGGPEAGYSVP